MWLTATFDTEPGDLVRLAGVLDRHCAQVGRNPSSLRRAVQFPVPPTPDALLRAAAAFARAGFTELILMPRGGEPAALDRPAELLPELRAADEPFPSRAARAEARASIVPFRNVRQISDSLGSEQCSEYPRRCEMTEKTYAAKFDRLTAVWRRSTRSYSDNCVEVADLPDGGRAVRDSKNPDGPILFFTPSEWAAFVGGAKDGEFDN
ncbi:hypothetical protein GCM10010168_36530 [Actinoplanes ianthinogenes]|uniref:DUF397 domain-containing protein n=1 Tax=Actinoplanes ianthinogenes TaxID=122358 RepID=A0ABN6CNQ1_9ACTN|nr:hypothetical protein Aiant_74820 [Actinoplanes ianthinogenes]GGR15261.1 hypothetical protein GCM10010168_36530 [Actinoplanes ianthinogenes]